MKRGLTFISRFPLQTWNSKLTPYTKIVSVSTDPLPSVTFSFTAQPHHSNGSENMHGGAIATLFDWSTSMPLAIVCKPGYWSFLGVTRTLNVTYLRPLPVGTEVLIENELVHAGRSLSLSRGVIRRKSDGAILATCEHNKANTDPPVAADSKL